MRIETPDDCLKVDALVESALGWEGTETVFSGASIRAGLAVLRPQSLVARWFRGGRPQLPPACTAAFLERVAVSQRPRQNNRNLRLTKAVLLSPKPWQEIDSGLLQTVAASFPKWVEAIRPLITRRSDLFAWVYGPSPATRELIYVRLPSRERRALIGYLRVGLRDRYRWLTTKHVSAMAFRPEVFDSLNTAPEDQAQWGPLYRRAVVQKGKKTRYLWIPNPVLKRVQKTLLRLLQPGVDRALSRSVFGARVGVAGPTFANAAQHLYRSAIVSFDLKDFFPSTTVADVIRGLQHLATRAPLAIDAARSTDCAGILPNWDAVQSLPWTDDLRVFVARLGTHRGRLPQGSPLSPLLANVAFSPFDHRISSNLDLIFGTGNVQYTRYFDDLTISVVAGSGGNLGKSRNAIRDKCQDIVAESLSGSSFRLNARKTRSGGTSSGHRVTGLVVRKDRVSLPRSRSRELRAIARAMQGSSFVEIAKRWAAVAGRPPYKFESVGRGHRAGQVRLRRHRLSAERLATFVLRRFYPDLSMRCILRHWYPWRERFESLDGPVGGKEVWPLIEWILSTLWTGRARAERIADAAGETVPNGIIIRQDDQPVCEISAESTLDFFFLPRDEAISVVECWHHFRGVLGYLSACPDRPEFEKVLDVRDRLRRGLAELTLPTPKVIAGVPSLGGDITDMPLTHKDVFDSTIGKWDDCLGEYVRLQEVDLGPRFGQLRSRVRAGFSTTADGFGEWVQSLWELLRICSRLPTAPEQSSNVPGNLLYDYIRVRALVAAGHVEPAYTCLGEFEARSGKAKAKGAPKSDLIQTRVAESLLHHFSTTLRGRTTNEAWEEGLLPNFWHGELSQVLEEQVVRLEELHARARTTLKERRLLRAASVSDLAEVRAELSQVVTTPASDRVWGALQSCSKSVYKVTFEAIEEELCSLTPPADNSQPRTWKRGEVRKASLAGPDRPSFKLLDNLRNRAAHGTSPERRKDWVSIQKAVATSLGRSWTPKEGSSQHPEYHAPDDLVLTAYEGTMMKALLLRGVNVWLERLAETQWWRLGSSG